MIRSDNLAGNEQITEESLSMKDFVMGDRITKVTTHDLLKLTRNNQVYVAKLFQPQFRHNFDLQLGILRQLKHENIVSLVYSQPAENEPMGLWGCNMLVIKWAEHGSLNEYVPMNGRLDENVARIIFKEMITGLKHAASHQPNPIIHLNLMPSSVLLDSQRHVRICGWSKESEKKDNKDLIKDLVFCCCEILILMLTGYMPFFKKDPKVDPLFRYLKPEYINKFWQIFEKRVSSKQKSFQFSKNAKELIQKVFLGEWKTLEEVQNSEWFKESTISRVQFNTYMLTIENQAKQRIRTSLQKQLQKSQQKRKIIMDYQSETLHGSSDRASRSSGDFETFLQDYYDCGYSKQDVPACQCSELIRVFDDRPSFVIASLKEHLRNLEHSQDTNELFGGHFSLQNYELQKDNHLVYLSLVFTQLHEELIDHEEDIVIKVKAVIKFFRNTKNQLFASVNILESNLSEFYVSQMTRFLEDQLR